MKNYYEIMMSISQRKDMIILFLCLIILAFSCEKKEEKVIYHEISEIPYKEETLHDSSVIYQVKDTTIKDTLFVNISITNISNKPVYIPLNQWFVFGWPNHAYYSDYVGYPCSKIPYGFNSFLYNNTKEWKDCSGRFSFDYKYTFPIIERLKPSKTLSLLIKIINSEFEKQEVKKLKIKANMMYSLEKDHKKFVDIFKIDEKKIIRERDTIGFIFDNNCEDSVIHNLNQKQFIFFTDSTHIDIYSIFPEIKGISYFSALLSISERIIYFRSIGYNINPSIIVNTLDEFDCYEKLSIEGRRKKDSKSSERFEILLSQIFLLTYKYPIYIRN